MNLLPLIASEEREGEGRHPINTHLLLSPALSSIRMEERDKSLANRSLTGLNSTPVGQCPVNEHRLHRRLFLKGLTGGALASVTSFTGLFENPIFAAATKKAQKHCTLLWLCGAPSQFETWDPKPGRPSGGPFGSLPTKTPGIHFSSLMPQCASIADKLNIVRSMKTAQSEHLQAITLLQRGNPERAGFTRPTLGSALSHAVGQLDSPIPNFVFIDPIPGGNEFETFKAGNRAGWMGAEHAPVRLGGNVNSLDGHTELLKVHRMSVRTIRNYNETLPCFWF